MATKAKTERPNCPDCPATKMVCFGRKTRKVKDIPRRGGPATLTLNLQRYQCPRCGRTLLPASEVLHAEFRMTKQLVAFLLKHGQERKQAELATLAGISEKTLRKVLQQR